MKTVKIKGKDYVMVVERLKYMANDQDAPYSIETFPEFMADQNAWFVKAKLTIESLGHFTGHAFEVVGDGMINKTSALENCETSAVGRALAMAGIGLIDDVASAEEVIGASDATDGQIQFIEQLIQTTTLSDEVVGQIENRIDSMTYDQAKKAISYLKENQLSPLDRGNMSMKEINKMVADKLNDEKA
jgi:hypothetical protein